MITYRTNRAGTLHAAYLGSVRVGYVEERAHGRWLWQLILLRPEGGAFIGKEDDIDEAKDALRTALLHWTECAGLQQKETTHDGGRDERALRRGHHDGAGDAVEESHPRQERAAAGRAGADGGGAAAPVPRRRKARGRRAGDACK